MFRSFYMAGFECATGYNSSHCWIDQISATQHDLHLEEDYQRLRDVGILTAREAVRWPLVDLSHRYDFSTVEQILKASESVGIELIYDLFHYGYPEGLDPFSKEFVDRFEDYCFECARFITSRVPGPYYFTPVNEPSYFAYAAGEAAKFAPHQTGRSYELKVNLARAAIRGIDAIRSVCPEARMVNADPLCRVVLPPDRTELAQDVEFFNSVAVYESWDMLSGRALPELGGSRRHLDIVGINYYWTNQWELGSPESPLVQDDPRLLPLSDLVEEAYRRYGGPMCISETAHVGDHREYWMRQVARDVRQLAERGVPLAGVCLYPVLGMPEWHEPDLWVPMGLWDVERKKERLHRRPATKILAALRESQQEAHQIFSGRIFELE